MEKFDSVPDIEIEEMRKKLLNLIKELKSTSSEVNNSYESVLKIRDVADLSDREVMIYQEMESMINNRFPINQFVEIIEALRDFDNAEELYQELVQKIDVSDREKQMLLSIVAEGRTGVVSISRNDEEQLCTIKVPKTEDSKQLAISLFLNLQEILSTYGSEGIAFSFEES